MTAYPLYKHSLQPKSLHRKFHTLPNNPLNPMQVKLSFHSPASPCKSLSHHCKPLFSVRRTRVAVSATTTQLQDSAPATETMYDLLGVREQAGLEEIKAAYRKQARQWHPDMCMSTEDKSSFAQRFMMARQAYEVLSDPELRRGYDSVLLRKGSGSQVCRRFGDWEAQLQGLQNRSGRVAGRESWGSRIRRAQHYGQSN